jgi:L-arabinose isomerase
MTNSGRPLEVWFVTGSQEMYGSAILEQVAEQSLQVATVLSQSSSAEPAIVWKPVLTNADAIRRVCLDATADDSVVGVIAWMHTFSPAKAWIAGLNVLGKPLLHLHTQANRALPWADIDMNFMNLNQSAHGDREFGYLQSRMGIARKTIAGHVADPEVVGRVDDWLRATTGWQNAQTMRMARFGDNMRDVAVTDGDKVGAQIALGVSVNSYSVDSLTAVVDSCSDAAVDALVVEYEDTYHVAAELRPGGTGHASLRYAARIELGLRSFLRDGGFSAFTTNFEDLGGLRQLPGLAVQRLMAEGYGFGAEGDWKTAALLRIVKAMSVGLTGGTSFMEDYTYHWGPGTAKILGAHMLEVCPSIADRTPSLEIHPLAIGGREDPVRLIFTARSGPAIVVGLTDLGGRLRLTANEVDIAAPDEPLPRLPVAHAIWVPRPNLAVSAECWLAAGGPHHTVLTASIGRGPLEDLAEIAGIELLMIDADTDRRRFAQELRWNHNYFAGAGAR